MKNGKKINQLLQYAILLLVVLGLTITSLEFYLSLQEKSLCKNESCIIVHSYDRYQILTPLGILFFFVLFILVTSEIFFETPKSSFFRKTRLFLLSIATLVEGYLVGFQVWFIGNLCTFCLTVAAIIFLTFVCEIFYQKAKPTLFFTICGSLGIFLSTFLVGENLKPLELKLPILIYKKTALTARKL